VIVLDVNVVVIAYRADHPRHADVRWWFDELLAGDDRFTVTDGVWASFIRLVTNRRVFPVPTPMDEAFEFLRTVRRQPHHQALVPGEEHLTIFERLCLDSGATGDLVPDAYLAALALEHGCAVVSLDGDFSRFEGLDWRRPG